MSCIEVEGGGWGRRLVSAGADLVGFAFMAMIVGVFVLIFTLPATGIHQEEPNHGAHQDNL